MAGSLSHRQSRLGHATIAARETPRALTIELDRQSAADPYFVEQGLYPFVDYYATIIYHAIGFPSELFPVLFAIPRFIGWAAQWDEMLSDPTQRTFPPRQIHIGPQQRT